MFHDLETASLLKIGVYIYNKTPHSLRAHRTQKIYIIILKCAKCRPENTAKKK